MKNLVKKYLQINQFDEKIEDFEDVFQSHPNFPSLYAITDTLDLLSIENIAVKIPKEQIIELPKDFLAVYNNNIVLVTKTTDTKISIETDDLKKSVISTSVFLESWNGVIIAIEPNIKIQTKTNSKTTSWLLYTLPFIALILLSIYYNNYNLNSFGTLLMCCIGLGISILILQEKFGVKNEITSKFCTISTNASCSSVITSKNSKINKFINFTDLPLLFFAISFLSILLKPLQSSFIIGFISTLSIPVIIYSVWLQKYQLKKWCLLCLLVSVLLVFQSVFFAIHEAKINTLFQINFSSFLFSTILVSSVWFFSKPLIENKFNLQKQNNKLNKFKRNFKLFQFLSKNIEEYYGFDKLKGVAFGNKNASTQLTLILSPSCGHCHKAFEDAYSLYQKFSEKIYLNILFNINPENTDNPYKIVVENLLALNEQNAQKAQEAIIDWHINNLDLENWENKWKVTISLMIVNQQMQNQYNWCLKNKLNYTPVKIINGKQFPENYEISDLKYFMNDFQQEIELEESLYAV